MKIVDFLDEKAIEPDLKATSKKEVLKELVDLLSATGEIGDKDEMLKTILDREALGSTGIGDGLGIPHGKSPNVKKLVGAFGLSKRGIDFHALDGNLVHIFFLLAAPEDSAGPLLKALAKISRLLKDKFFRDSLRKSASGREILRIISQEDERRH